MMAALPTPRPWAVGRLGKSLWIEGPAGSASSETFPADRVIVADLHLTGNAKEDAVAAANANLIVEAVNGLGDAA